MLCNLTTIAIQAAPAAADQAGRTWTNSLRMVFTSLPGPRVQFSIWETRVRDFEAYVLATGNDPHDELVVFRQGRPETPSWRKPGFKQSLDDPVVLVSWEDAKLFCAWLTTLERNLRVINASQYYRLPTDAEWSQAAGAGKYPWSELLPPPSKAVETSIPAVRRQDNDDLRYFPPPKGAGNYAGNETQAPDSADPFKSIRGYEDNFARTAPVGSFTANRNGIYDLGGNVWEWCDDWYRTNMISKELEQKLPFYNADGGGHRYRVIRGASWRDSHPAILRTECRCFEFPDHRTDTIGFRIILEGK